MHDPQDNLVEFPNDMLSADGLRRRREILQLAQTAAKQRRTRRRVEGGLMILCPAVVLALTAYVLMYPLRSRPIDVSRYGLIYGGAQKNIGPAGLTFVIVRDDLLGGALKTTPQAFDYTVQAANNSMINTPPTYAIYIAGLVFQWLKRQGGVAEMERRNVAKADLLYNYLDSTEFYTTRIARDCRSRMNAPFFLHDDALNETFLTGAKERGLLQLKGHKSVGGMRASIYNAMPIEGVEALVTYLRDFEQTYG